MSEEKNTQPEEETEMNEEEVQEKVENPEEDVESQTEVQPEPKDEQEQTYMEQLQRLQAEFQNYKKRTDAERLIWQDFGAQSIVTQILPILDDFELLFHHKQDEVIDEQAVKLIYDKFWNAMKAAGVEAIDSEGTDFDPELHEALQMQKTDKMEAGKILQVWQNGYKFKEKMIRPAKVIVSEQPDEQ